MRSEALHDELDITGHAYRLAAVSVFLCVSSRIGFLGSNAKNQFSTDLII
jgi:hypothetical protein